MARKGTAAPVVAKQAYRYVVMRAPFKIGTRNYNVGDVIPDEVVETIAAEFLDRWVRTDFVRREDLRGRAAAADDGHAGTPAPVSAPSAGRDVAPVRRRPAPAPAKTTKARAAAAPAARRPQKASARGR